MNNCIVDTIKNSNDFEQPIFNARNIPEELKEYDQWVLWKLEPRKEKLTKVPYTVEGHFAKVNDPETWTSFDKALEVYQNIPGTYSGLGFVFRENDPFIGIDFDHIRDPTTGMFEDINAFGDIIDLNSYAEFSQSGTGAHVICMGKMPGPEKGIRSESREMYFSDRFFALTGDLVRGRPATINEAPETLLKAVYDKIVSAQKSQNGAKGQKQNILRNVHQTDKDIIELCQSAANGEKVKELFNGNWTGKYESQSEADLALCSLIAFNTKDPEQIDRIFRSSKLCNEKWLSREDYRKSTIQTALKGLAGAKEKIEVSKPEVVLKEPYIIAEDRIYLNVVDSKENHLFAYLGNNNHIEYVKSLTLDGRTVYPQELPLSKNGKPKINVGIPLQALINSSLTMPAEELYELIKSHLSKYIDMTEQDLEVFTQYILFTWFYRKLNTVPYLRFLGDTGKGKTRMLNVVGDLCFYPITASGNSTASGITRFNELWHGTLKMNEIDKAGHVDFETITYMNLGFEKGNYYIKNNNVDLSKQEVFDPFCPKIVAMRRRFNDSGTEGRFLTSYPRETTNPNIPIILPSTYSKEVERIRALIARFVLFNWSIVDEDKLLNCNDMDIEPRSKQLAIPLSIVLQLVPEKEEIFKDYFLSREGKVRKDRSETSEGIFFNYIYSLAVGDEKPITGFENFVVEDNVVAITPTMVAKYFNTSTKNVTKDLSMIGIISESNDVMMFNDSGELKKKKNRMYVVPDGAAWREMAKRYLGQGSEEEGVGNIPECPDVLKAKGYVE